MSSTETKLVRVQRRKFYDAYGEITYFLRVPEGMTNEEIEHSHCWHDGIDKGEDYVENGVTFTCVGRIDDSDEQVIRTLESTGGVETNSVTEITEQQLAQEVQA